MVQDKSDDLDASELSEQNEMARLLEEEISKMPSLRRGEALEGKVILINEEGILVNIGAKSEGVVPMREIRSLGDSGVAALSPGDPIVTVMMRQEDNGQYLLSYDKAQAERGWIQLEQEMEDGNSIEVTVTGYNRGGLLVDALGVQGFVPLSQLSSDRRSEMQESNEEQIAEILEKMIGEELSLKIIEVNKRRQRAILSERVFNQEERDEQRMQLMSELTEGSIVKGRVTGVREFGAFVDLGGIDGLIHISELSWQPVEAPSDIVQPSDEIDVFILKVDMESGRISLSLRRTEPDPWQIEISKFSEGEIVEATITRLTPFGAFAKIQDNIEGLIHISELSENHVRHPKEIVHEGDSHQVKILRIEPERRRLGLSIRQVQDTVDVSETTASEEIAPDEQETASSEEESDVTSPEKVDETTLEDQAVEGTPEKSDDSPEDMDETSEVASEGDEELVTGDVASADTSEDDVEEGKSG